MRSAAWWSRYWAYTDQEFKDLVQQFRENDVPLDVLVIDMDWHPTFGVRWWENKKDQSGHVLGWTGYTLEPAVLSRSRADFWRGCTSRG